MKPDVKISPLRSNIAIMRTLKAVREQCVGERKRSPMDEGGFGGLVTEGYKWRLQAVVNLGF
jgi:hypothetical protein